MDKIRTPDERFKDLVDWPFEPRYVNLDEDLRVHYVDEGTGPTVLLSTVNRLGAICIEK